MSKGVRIGLRDVHYALLLGDGASSVSYDDAEPIKGAISAVINHNPSTDTLFADDGPMETAAAVGSIELELEVADLPLQTQADLLGHDTPSGGEIERKADDVPPWVAVGFRSLKSNGTYRYTWLLKGKFMVPEQPHETKRDTVSFQTPTIVGSFVKRDYDDVYEIIMDEDPDSETAYDPDDWFDASILVAKYKE